MNWQYKKCKNQYANQNFAEIKWCICNINYLKNDSISIENEKVNNLVQEMRSKISNPNGVIFEWIPYNQFDNIIKIGENEFSIVYSAIWKDGPLLYNVNEYDYLRNQRDKKVILKYLHNSHHFTDEFLN